MATPMTPSASPITAGQIGKINDNLAAALRKSTLQSGPVQQVLEHHGDALTQDLYEVVRRRVKVLSNIIVRRVRVDRTRLPQQALAATGCVQYTDCGVVETMPGKGESVEEVEVVFFKVGEFRSDDNLEKDLDLWGLKPVDPYALAAVNAEDPVFADEHPNGTHWKDNAGKWCLAAFHRCYGERSVVVYRNVYDWSDGCWFAAIRKPAQQAGE